MILVPKNTPGVKIIRPMTVFGNDHRPHGHMEIVFDNVRVPPSNLLLGEGRGFEIAQGRLGPGRIHHCMRLIGMAERALEAMCKRVEERVAFGRTLAERDTIRADIADSRMEIEQSRLLVFNTADRMDKVGNKEARVEISMIKVVVPNMAQRVIDRAMQCHGAAGISQDFFLADAWIYSRICRIADGPDEVHRGVISSVDIKPNWHSHDLARLWSEFLAMLDEYGTDDPDEVDPVVGEIILEFAKIDPGSYAYRYPVDKKGVALPVAFSDVHLPTLADVMDAVAGYSPVAATSSNRPGAPTSSCSCVNAKGMAGVKPFRTTASAVPATEVTSLNDP